MSQKDFFDYKNNIRSIEYNLEDYTQSANSLFHFMDKDTFLEEALSYKALLPRYCLEDIEYLNLSLDGQTFNEIAVLQKCFCDIPLHRIATHFDLVLTEDSAKELSVHDLQKFSRSNSHPSYYGEYAIAFSKIWCEQENLQPVHYLSNASRYTSDFSELVNTALNSQEIPDEYARDILQRLALVKPLRGQMKRYIKEINKEIRIIKNFHDEQEWRYIPQPEKALNMSIIIANPNLLSLEIGSRERFINMQSSLIRDQQYCDMWLNFDYSDIRYLIVPDNQARLKLISYIINLPQEQFNNSDCSEDEKYMLISKILVLSEIGKDI